MAEKEYIEREALIKKLEEQLSDLLFIVNYEKRHGSLSDVEKSKARFEEMKGVINLVKSQPTADVQEVRHEQWEYENSDIGWTDYRCSDCGNIISTVAQDGDLYSYCPHCGAKMDKERMTMAEKNKWEYIDGEFGFAEFRCSKCHKSVSEDYDDISEFEFCPHCGTEMDNKEWEGAGRE